MAPHDIAAHSVCRVRDVRTVTVVAIDMRGEDTSFASSCGAKEARDQTLPKMRVPLVPPNPKEFFTATLIGILRAVLAQ